MDDGRPLFVLAPVWGRVDSVEEPVWLVRIVILLFLIGFAAFLAREVRFILESLG